MGHEHLSATGRYNSHQEAADDLLRLLAMPMASSGENDRDNRLLKLHQAGAQVPILKKIRTLMEAQQGRPLPFPDRLLPEPQESLLLPSLLVRLLVVKPTNEAAVRTWQTAFTQADLPLEVGHLEFGLSGQPPIFGLTFQHDLTTTFFPGTDVLKNLPALAARIAQDPTLWSARAPTQTNEKLLTLVILPNPTGQFSEPDVIDNKTETALLIGYDPIKKAFFPLIS